MSDGGSGEIILYTDPDGAQVQLRTSGGTVWLTLSEMASLYATTSQNIGQIVRRILEENEVDRSSTKSEFVVRREGNRDVRREVTLHNLDMTLAVGYRVTTPRAVQFRQWATSVLREYLVKGFALQDERLKDPAAVDYFDELLERIRDIRSSEKRFYQKVREIFSATSVDYVGTSDTARGFFATVQNKLLFAVTGRTAGELIVERSDPAADNMGLTSWKGPAVRKGDVAISKNYLTPDELSELNLLTTRFLDFAEDRARRRQQITMAEWVAQTDRFLTFDERSILSGPGTVSARDVDRVTAERYAAYDQHRRTREAAQAELDEERDTAALTALENLAKSNRREPHGADEPE